MRKALLMWDPFVQSRAGVHSKDSAKPLKVTLLTEPLAGDTCRINSTKKCSGTASPAQIKFHCRSKPFQKKKLPQADGHISPVSPRAEEACVFVIIKPQYRKNFIDDGIAKKKIQLWQQGEIRHKIWFKQYIVTKREGRVSPKYTKVSDKDGNSFAKTFKEKVMQEGERHSSVLAK